MATGSPVASTGIHGRRGRGPGPLLTDSAIGSLFPPTVVRGANDAATSEGPGGAIDAGELAHLAARFGSEARCRAYLERLRWPDGVRCPRCDGSDVSRIEKRGQFDCGSCGYQFSVRVGTIFQNSHLPLWKWFLAAYIMGESESGISANRLKGILGVPYKTAWYLCHRIRTAMTDGKEPSARAIPVRLVPGRSHVSVKHLPKYLNELAFRSSNRGNRYLFRDILLRLIQAESMPYTELIATA